MAVLDNLIVQLSADASGFDSTMKSVAGGLDSFAGKAKSIGGSLTAGVTLPLVGIGVAATAMATKMNSEMANVASLGLLPERVLELKGNVQEMAIATGKSTSDLTEGLYNVVSAFGDSADTALILEINAKAAAAGLASTTDAINLTSAVTKGYGDTSAEAVQQVSDLAFTAVRLGQTTFPELAGAMGKVVPLANEMGISQEELFAVMATGTGVTGTASEVVTQMRGTLQSLMAPTADMTALIEEQGFASGKAMLEQLGYKGTMDAIVAAAEASGTPLAKYMGSIEGQTLALALAGSQSDTYGEKLAEMGLAAGASDAAFAAQTEGINASGFAMAQAAIKGQVLMQKLGDGLAPAVSKVFDIVTPWVDKLIEMVDWFANADESTQTWIVAIVALVAAIGPVLTIVGMLAGGISTVIGVVGAVSGAMGGLGVVLAVLTGPIGLIIAAVALLAAAWITDFGGIRTKTEEFWSWLTGQWPGWMGNLQTGWQNFSNWWQSDNATKISSVKMGWANFTGWLSQNTQSGLSGVQGVWQNFTGWLDGHFGGHWQTIRGVAQTGMDMQKGIITAGLQFMRGDWEGGLQTLRSTAENAWSSIYGLFGTQIDSIRNIITQVDWASVGSAIMQGIARGITSGVGWIQDAARNAAQSALQTAKSWLGIGSPSQVAAQEIGEPFAQGIGVGFSRGLTYVAGQIGNSLNSMVGNLSAGAANALSGIKETSWMEQALTGQVGTDPIEKPIAESVIGGFSRGLTYIAGHIASGALPMPEVGKPWAGSIVNAVESIKWPSVADALSGQIGTDPIKAQTIQLPSMFGALTGQIEAGLSNVLGDLSADALSGAPAPIQLTVNVDGQNATYENGKLVGQGVVAELLSRGIA